MPNPTAGSVHQDTFLTDTSVAHIQSSTKFVADRVFPRVSVAKQSDKIATFNTQDFLRDEVEKRQAGDEAVQIGYRTASTTYIADEWAAEHAIDDQVSANADAPYSPEEDAVKFLTQKLLIKREREWVTNFFSTGDLWTGSSDAADLVGATDFTQWSNAASTPLEDIHNASARIERQTGFLPNKLVVNRDGWYDLKNHPDIVDRIKHTSDKAVTTDLVARLMGIDELLVTAAVHYNAGEGLSTAAGAYVGDDEALLVYAPPSPSLMTPSGGYTFTWTGLIGSNEGQVIERYRDDRRLSDIIRIRGAWAQKRIVPSLGVLFTDVSTRV
jgi:hypothetical protein